MRLIDADKIEINEECTFSGKGIKAFLDVIPTTYDVDKVVERLKSVSIPENKVLYESSDEFVQFVKLKDAVEIVKSGGIE